MILASVIIPTYNYANYICEAVESVFNQVYTIGNVEVIVVDDGSTDNTKEILQPYVDKNLIKYYYQTNKGKAAATSLAVHKCNGKYIFNLDADDYFLADKIQATVNIFESNENVVHVASPAKISYQNTGKYEFEDIPAIILDKVIDGKDLLDFFYNRNILFGGGTTYAARANVLKSITIPSDVDMYIDEFLLLAILRKGKSYFIREPLSVWRVHTSNYSGNTSSKERQIEKGQRLLDSSHAVLKYIKANDFKDEIVKIYALIDEIRNISHKENLNEKGIKEIFKYAYKVSCQIKPPWLIVKKYDVLNRLVPTFLLIMLKQIKKNI